MATISQTKFEYLQQREELIDADRALRRDRLFADTFSPLEKEADAIVRRIRAEEATGIWKEDHADVPHPFPGMEFLTGKKIVEKTRIFEILSRMPKGALLHAHLGATVDVRTLVKLALKQPAIHIRVPHPISATNISSTLPEFMALPVDEYNLNSGVGITSTNYVPKTWVGISEARDSFDPALGGPEGFDKWVADSMMIHPEEAYGTHNTVEKIWKKFQNTFTVSGGLLRFLPILKEYFKVFMLDAVNDGIFYTEPRFVFFVEQGAIGADGLPRSSRDVAILCHEAIQEVKEELASAGRSDKFIGARMIYTTFKAVPPEELYAHLENCISLKKEFPELIAGYDLVGAEDSTHPIIDYIEPLLHFRKRIEEEGIDLPFLFHAGETLGDGDASDSNLYDALLLGTKRVGHGFSLVKHPELMRMCREQNILLEVCPISNEVLRLTSSMPAHPLPVILNNGIPVALGSDDPSAFGNMGLIYDFFQVLVSSELSGLSTLGILARDSVLYSMMPSEEKSRALSVWEAEWKVFLNYIISNHK